MLKMPLPCLKEDFISVYVGKVKMIATYLKEKGKIEVGLEQNCIL